MNKKRRIILIVSLISILIMCIIGGTLAFFGWLSEKEALVNVTVSSGAGSCTLKNDNEIEMFPTYSKYHGRKIKLNARQEMSEKAYITWTMVINEINGLQDKTFMYELVNNTTGKSYGNGTFENITNTEGNNTITFSNNDEVLGYNKDYEFTLYLWIDGTLGDNSISMSDQAFDFDMNCSITGTDNGIVEEQYVLMSIDGGFQSTTSKFLRSDLTREQISSITFVNDMDIPEDAIDVSQKKDNSVMMWYGEANSNNLYDVYIGTNGGKISLRSGYDLFAGLTNVQTLDLSDVNTSNVTTMQRMFNGSSSLTSLNLSSFDTTNVINMQNMFNGCSKLISLDLSNFDTSNVTDMTSMFLGCSDLTTLNVSFFNTSNVTFMNEMFVNCSSLMSLNVSNFNTSKLTSMYRMFHNCSNLTSLDVSNFDTSNITNMQGMFSLCSNLTSLDLSNFDTSNVELLGEYHIGWYKGMFEGCSKLTTIDLSSFDTSNVINMSNMFGNCSSLESIIFGDGFDTSKVTNMQQMFTGCSSLTTLDLSKFNTSSVTNMSNMFYGCSNLIILDLSTFDTSNVTNMQSMFKNCKGLTTLDLSSFNTSKVTNMRDMINNCKNLTALDISSWNVSNVIDMQGLFFWCSSLKNIDMRNAEFSDDTNVQNMFYTVPKDATIYVKDDTQKQWITSRFTNLTGVTVPSVSV